MHSYDRLKQTHGKRVPQTVDEPIMILDFWELQDAFAALLIILIFGVVFYSWSLMFTLLMVVLWAGPMIRKKNNKGIFFHWPYRFLNMSLPGLFNPKGKRRFSD